ncbi:MAG: hypothetical protein IKE25_07285 [Clostridia bacterium]|nr:hypothetical protein [Clostridia bacterium]
MKKQFLTLALAMMLMICSLPLPAAVADAAGDLAAELAAAADGLSVDQPYPYPLMVYCSPRYMDPDMEKGVNLQRGLYAKQINTDTSGRSYGLYLKITPRAQKEMYTVNRFDITVSLKDGPLVYVEGFHRTVNVVPGYLLYWNFFRLDGMYDNMKTLFGEVLSGTYILDVYFDGLWAGSTSFYIH